MSDSSQKCVEMPGPGAEHQRLEPFAGTFAAEVKMFMGPEPMVSTGTMVSSWVLGGRFLKQEYKGDAVEGPFPNFEGQGYWGFNTVSKKYEGVWIDNASTMMQTEKGDVDAAGKVWTMVGTMDNPETGEPMIKRTVITLVDDNRHSMEMFFDTPTGPGPKGMEIQYTRK